MHATPISRTRSKKYRELNRNTQIICSMVPNNMADHERMRVRQPLHQSQSRGYIEMTYRRAVASFQTRLSGALPYPKVVGGHRGMR